MPTSTRRDKIINIVKFAYLSIAHDNLPIFGIAKQKTLEEFTTRESDVSRGISRMPLILARLYEEDIKFVDKNKHKISPKAVELNEADTMLENLKDNIDYRNDSKQEAIRQSEAYL